MTATSVLPARAQKIVATIATGAGPFAVAVNTVTNKIYVTNGNSLTVIDGVTNATTTISVGSNPGPVAVNSVTNKIYVGCGSEVTVVDGATGATTSVSTGTNPYSIAVNLVTNKIYIADSNNFINGSVIEIDGVTNTATTVTDGFLVGPVAVNPVTNKIYVCGNVLGGEATVIDGATHATAPLGGNYSPSGPMGPIPYNPDAIVVNTVTNKIYIGNQNQSEVTLIDGPTNDVSSVGLSDAVVAIALNMTTDKVYAVSQGTTGIMVIDGATNATTLVATGSNSYGVTVNPVTNVIYVARLAADGTVAVIDGSTNAIFDIAVGTDPFAVAVNPVTNRIYVLNNDAVGTLTVLDGTPVTVAPAFANAPTSQTVNVGSSVAFNAAASGMPAPAYQWSFNGVPLSDGNGISGSSSPLLYLSGGASLENAGTYTCAATNSAGTATSAATALTVVSTMVPGHLINISSRSFTGTLSSDILIAGFVVSGDGENTLILRGVGPSLANFGVPNVAGTPTLSLFDASSPAANLITVDSGWQTPPSAPAGFWSGKATPVDATEADFEDVGAFALTSGSGDSALKVALPAGAYTSQIIGTNESGTALAEVYLVDTGNPGAQLINVSSRAYVVGDENILIAGFVISGSTSETVLIRASGPALASFGVANTLPDPELLLYDSDQNLVASNIGWEGSPQITTAASTVGAFSWGDPTSADSAILITLPPGSYTAQVAPLTGDQGTALVEVYALP